MLKTCNKTLVDGTARMFDVDVAGAGVALPAADAPAGAAIHDIAWSPTAHCVAVACAAGPRQGQATCHLFSFDPEGVAAQGLTRLS
jgi:hypothetical protein